MIIVDILAVAIIALNGWTGYKHGAIKGIFQLIGLLAICIVAFQFKDLLADVLIKYLPFFDFPGKLGGLFSLNFILYKGISFIVLFILLYCILNILLNVSGFVDVLVKMNLIFDLPSKIIGAVFGVIEGCIIVFICAFTFLHAGHTQKITMESTVLRTVVERMPVVNMIFAKSTVVGEKTYMTIQNIKEDSNPSEANLEIVRHLIQYGVVSSKTAQECIDNKKLRLENVVVSS